MRLSLSVSGTLRALPVLGRHPLAVRFTALSLVGCAALGALELAGVPIGAPTDEMIARQKRNQALAQRYSDTCHQSIQTGDPAGAITLCTEAVQLDPVSVQAQRNLGIALLKSGKPEEAIPFLREATRLDPDREEAHFLLANAFRDQGHLEWAGKEYEATLRINPNNVEAHYSLAVAHWHFGRNWENFDNVPGPPLRRDADAIREYREAIRSDPGYLPAYDRLIPLLQRYDRRSEAAQLEQQRAEIVLHAAERCKLFVGLRASQGIQ